MKGRNTAKLCRANQIPKPDKEKRKENYGVASKMNMMQRESNLSSPTHGKHLTMTSLVSF